MWGRYPWGWTVKYWLSVFFVLVFVGSFWWAVWESFKWVCGVFGVWE